MRTAGADRLALQLVTGEKGGTPPLTRWRRLADLAGLADLTGVTAKSAQPHP
ncbi:MULTISPECIES: hypothetical protein [unclassified Streptomyces]|uniref:hypothetical protein n=1 Tax=unclassified Streptomyces TaxID=2593676 RepID=UPI003428BF1D